MRHQSRFAGRLLAALVLALLAFAATAQPSGHVDVYVFWAKGCPHCERELEFLKRLEATEPRVRVHALEVSGDGANRAALVAVAERLALADLSVPLTFVGDAHLIGYDRDATTGAELRRLIDHCAAHDCPDTVGSVVRGFAGGNAMTGAANRPALRHAAVPREIALPLFGMVRTADLSLPMLTIVLGALDGFNPCAMWVLLFLLSMLVHLQDRRRMALIAGTFVLVSGVVYYAFMAAWLNFFLLIGFTAAVRWTLGVLALVIGAINVKDFLAFGSGITLSIPESAKPGLYARMRGIINAQALLPALAMVTVLAVLVNFIEALCTAGLPAIYTAVLTQQAVSPLAHYAYLGLYIVGYIADDALMVTVAVIALSNRKLSEGAGRWLKLVSGAVMLGLGVVLLLRPEWLAG